MVIELGDRGRVPRAWGSFIVVGHCCNILSYLVVVVSQIDCRSVSSSFQQTQFKTQPQSAPSENLAGAHIGVSETRLVHQRQAANGQEPSAMAAADGNNVVVVEINWWLHPLVG